MKATLAFLIGLTLTATTRAGDPAPAAAPTKPATAHTPAPRPDLTREPTLYVVGYAHLDTEWRWCYPQTIREFIANTLHDNFKLFDKYPSYVFNFTGSRRYQMMREYYPAEFEKLRAYIAAGRWFPCGSSVDENDANVPSAESIIRQVLYGNKFFRAEYGIASDEYMLPDCFGFPAALPSLLSHCGLKGFSTQKLTWGLAIGQIPFKVGEWIGPDGRGVMAAFDPGAYVGEVLENLATSDGWNERIKANGKRSGLFVDYHYYGTGDQGGAPTERSVKMVDDSVKTKGPLHIVSGPADWMFNAISPEQRKGLPRYEGELLLTEHSAGSITSQAYMKRWNRKNELLADAAERASVAAWWLGGRAYPSKKIEDAWYLVLGSQMHDILPGTSHPTAYDYAWNDEVIAANQFASVLEDGAGVVCSALDTRGDGTPLVVFNPLSADREDIVEAEIPCDNDADAMQTAEVIGPDGKTVPAQVIGRTTQLLNTAPAAKSVRVAFLAKAPSVGFATYHVRLHRDPASTQAELKVDEKRLENARYVVTLNDAGDVSSILDKTAARELLASPIRLGLHYENPRNWPAWNQDWSDRQLPAKEFVGGPATFRVSERGPARIAVEVMRTLGGSTFRQTIRLSAGGASDRVEFDNQIDWAQRERSLRAHFPLTVKNPYATYDIQVGTIRRPNMMANLYEAVSHQWFDLTDAKRDYGVTIMNDCKFGSDKPDDQTLRLTLLHTPGTRGGYQDQGTQDLGRHHVLFAVQGHAGDWRDGNSPAHAARLNQPLAAFVSPAHPGALGKSFSLLKISDARRRDGYQKAEASDEVVIRLRELSGKGAGDVRIALTSPIASAREIDGQEREIAKAEVVDGALNVDLKEYALRAFALKLAAPPVTVSKPKNAPLKLAFDSAVATGNAHRGSTSIDGRGRSYPAEQWPATLDAEETTFTLASPDGKNALTCKGQEITLPDGNFDRVSLLWASSQDSVDATVQIDGKHTPVRVRPWQGYVGQWDRRLWAGDVPELAFAWKNDLDGIEPGWVHPENVAWFCSHHHTPKGDAHYLYSYMYKTTLDLPPGAKTIRLPDDARVKLFAATASSNGIARVTAAAPLYDRLDDRTQDAPRIVPDSGTFTDAAEVRIEPRLYWRNGAVRYALDDAQPTTSGLVYRGPIKVSRTTTIRAAIVDGQGRLGPISVARIEVNDITPPTLKGMTASYKSRNIRLEFSEPIGVSAESAKNYSFDPPLTVRSATRDADGRIVTLELAAAPDVDRTYHFRVTGIRDESPAKHEMKPASLELRVRGPVFQMASVADKDRGKTLRDVAGLPLAGKSEWTLNLRVKLDRQPDNRTVLVGFGRCDQQVGGAGRFLAKFSDGWRLWAHNRDVESGKPLALKQWQMLTATYDGATIRLYADGKKLAESKVDLSDDVNEVHIAPKDPWDNKRQFKGDIRDLSIWDTALSDEGVAALMAGGDKP